MIKITTEMEEYKVTGKAIDHEWLLNNRPLLEGHLLEDMRANGLVPVLDMSPGLTFTYDQESETFEFELTAKGYKIGEEAVDYLGIIVKDGILVSMDAKRVSLYDSGI